MGKKNEKMVDQQKIQPPRQDTEGRKDFLHPKNKFWDQGRLTCLLELIGTLAPTNRH